MLDWRRHLSVQSLQVTKWSTAASARPAEGRGEDHWHCLGRVQTAPRRICFPSVRCNKPARTQLILQQNKAEHCLVFSDRFLLKNTHSALMGVGEQATWPQLGRDHPTCLATASASTAVPPGAAPCTLLLTSSQLGPCPSFARPLQPPSSHPISALEGDPEVMHGNKQKGGNRDELPQRNSSSTATARSCRKLTG